MKLKAKLSVIMVLLLLFCLPVSSNAEQSKPSNVFNINYGQESLFNPQYSNKSTSTTPEPTPVAAELPPITDSALIKKLQSAASNYFSSTLNMGISVGIVYNGKVLYINYGKTKTNGIKTTKNTLYEIGSLTKLFTATAIADIANQDKISLNDRLDKYLGFSLPAYNNKRIKLLDVATHTSGFPRLPSDWPNSSDPYKYYTYEKMLTFLKSLKLTREPGKTYLYSNLGYWTLGYVLQSVTGKSFEKVVKENICDKLDMNNTAVTLSKEQKARLATPHFANGNITNNWTFTEIMSSGGLKSNTRDMSRFIAANLGKLASDQNLQAAFKTAQKTQWTDGNRAMGLSWFISDISRHPVLYHDGLTDGYSSTIILCPDKSAGVIALCNNGAGGNSSDVYPLASALLKELMASK